MKKSSFLLLVVSILISCATSSHVVPANDSAKQSKSFSLNQILETQFTDIKASTKGRPDYKINSTYVFEEKKNTRPLVMVNFSILNPGNTSRLQPDLFIELDNERLRIDSGNHSPANRNIIPENLWISIVNAHKIGWILYSGKEPIELRLNQLQSEQLKEFLNKAIQVRDEKFPAIPKGMKRW